MSVEDEMELAKFKVNHIGEASGLKVDVSSPIIYYKKFNEPKIVTQRIGEKEHEIETTGEWICTDERVDIFLTFFNKNF